VAFDKPPSLGGTRGLRYRISTMGESQ